LNYFKDLKLKRKKKVIYEFTGGKGPSSYFYLIFPPPEEEPKLDNQFQLNVLKIINSVEKKEEKRKERKKE